MIDRELFYDHLLVSSCKLVFISLSKYLGHKFSTISKK